MVLSLPKKAICLGSHRRNRLYRKRQLQLVSLGDVSNFTPRGLEDMSIATNITRFRWPEDSAWDLRRGEKHRNDAYFVTTADINTNCRLWRLRFADISKAPEKGHG